MLIYNNIYMILYLLNFFKSLFILLFKYKKYLEIQHLRYIAEKQSEKFIKSFCLNFPSPRH